MRMTGGDDAVMGNDEKKRLTSVLGHLVGLQIRLDRLVLLVELGHVGYEILDDVHYAEGSGSEYGRIDRGDE